MHDGKLLAYRFKISKKEIKIENELKNHLNINIVIDFLKKKYTNKIVLNHGGELMRISFAVPATVKSECHPI